MSQSIIELPVDRVQEAVDFAKAMNCPATADQVRYTVSLLASDEDRIIGLALAHEVGDGRIDLYVGYGEGSGESGGDSGGDSEGLTLARQLADKALHKIHSQGVHRCRIVPMGKADCREFWQQVNWLDHALTS
ncbi:MAG: hypothetical protein IT445_09870 [Phycisphaeraceae bacterium]|nr:hypothetical protein [Phycisphaeraceae bacterium]